MVRPSAWITALAVLSLGTLNQSGSVPASLSLPAHLAGYRSWSALVKDPHPVPFSLWLRCMPTTAQDWETARKTSGPHTQRFVRVYGNAAATSWLREHRTDPAPADAIVVKEKLAAATDSDPDGVAFMIKRRESAFQTSGGWEFSYFPAGRDDGKTQEACAACHRNAGSNDYVFGRYDR